VSEVRRALVAAALGVALGVVAAVFSRKERVVERSRWPGRYAT
jgi:hypothetical protein